jgi:hypothetical protein
MVNSGKYVGWCEIRVFNGDEYVDVSILGCDVVWSCPQQRHELGF